MTHKILQKGDIVLIKDPMTKASNYPMAIVKKMSVKKNINDEVTGAIVMKGKKQEKILKRNISTLIPLLINTDTPNNEHEEFTSPVADVNGNVSNKPKRKAAIESEKIN